MIISIKKPVKVSVGFGDTLVLDGVGTRVLYKNGESEVTPVDPDNYQVAFKHKNLYSAFSYYQKTYGVKEVLKGENASTAIEVEIEKEQEVHIDYGDTLVLADGSKRTIIKDSTVVVAYSHDCYAVSYRANSIKEAVEFYSREFGSTIVDVIKPEVDYPAPF